jgi:hypothetical protein
VPHSEPGSEAAWPAKSPRRWSKPQPSASCRSAEQLGSRPRNRGLDPYKQATKEEAKWSQTSTGWVGHSWRMLGNVGETRYHLIAASWIRNGLVSRL